MWIRDVDVPTELVEAARAGQLVVFVGAGASRDAPSSLPDFNQLITEVGTRAGETPTARDYERPDAFLGSLEDLDIDVHSLVAKAIDIPGSAPNALHRAIVDVAQQHAPMRIVTTNYDEHLTTAALEAGVEVDVFRAPALPVGDDFEGLVHLHGALTQPAKRLVVTDKDFGRAYLREAWAARFLERMFAQFTTLFVGYSHGDIVMQYLARSLAREGTRFVLTAQSDLPAWRSLGLTPIEYHVEAGSHLALTETLRRWAELASLGRTEHRRLIADIVEPGPPSIPEEVSYLEECLGHPERVRYFVEKARGGEWLAWVSARPEFDRLFGRGSTLGGDEAEVTRVLTDWVVDQFVMKETESPAALKLLRERAWSPATRYTITHRLFAQTGALLGWQAPWLVLSLHQTPTGPNDLLDMLLRKASMSDQPRLARLLLEHRIRAVPKSGFDFGEPQDPPRFDVELSGDEYWLTEAWKHVFVPMLDEHAALLLELTTGQLRAAYLTLRSLRADDWSDTLSFGRSAIEQHPQDEMRESLDVLIDAARDCLERLLAVDPPRAHVQLERWARDGDALFRRLAVHGWRIRNDLSADQKLAWIHDQGLLYDLEAQHEVYVLLEACVPHGSEQAVQGLLEQALAGPPLLDGEEQSSYRRYNLLVWLSEVAPESEQVAAAFTQVQAEHQDYGPREHPDLQFYIEGGFVEDAEPFSADELHAKITQDPGEAFVTIRGFQDESETLRFTGPTWSGALKSVRSTVTRYPDDGLALSGVLSATDTDIRRTLIEAWAAAQLDKDQARSVIEVIASWDVGQVRGSAARMLANGGSPDHPTAWHQHETSRDLASRLWPDHPVDGVISADDDLLLEAINHPAGDLAQFWTKVIAHVWREDQASWTGVPAALRLPLAQMLAAEGRNGLLARCILGANLRFYFGADSDWASTNLLPLFDWDVRSDDAAAVWQGFLSRSRPDDGLLEAGFLAHYLQTCQHTEELGRDRLEARLAAHLASITMFASVEPRTWWPAYIKTAPDELVVLWARHIANLLADLSSEEAAGQWDRWVRDYWSNRIESVPRPITKAEGTAMAEWVLGLPAHRAEAVELLEATPTELNEHDQLLHDLLEQDLSEDPVTWTRFLLAVLRGTTDRPWAIGYYLKDVVTALKAANPAPDLSAVIEEAMRLGCTDAPDW